MRYSSADYTAVHPEPAWRAQADFIIVSDLASTASFQEREQLWARQTAEFKFVLCCIPFFAYDLALGDEVETDRNYVIHRVIRPSGHCTFRVWFGESQHPSVREEVVDIAKGLGCELEWSSSNLLAVDASTNALAQKLADYLSVRQSAGHLVYETGRTI